MTVERYCYGPNDWSVFVSDNGEPVACWSRLTAAMAAELFYTLKAIE